MKLALLADAYLTDESTSVDGTQVQLYQLAHAFAARGHEVHYVCATRSPFRVGESRDGAVTLHYLRARHGAYAWIGQIREMGRRLSKIAPDAVYQRGRAPLTYLAARWARQRARPFVWGSNGEDSGEFFKYCKLLLRSKRGWLRKLLLLPDSWLRDLCVHRGLSGATRIVSQTAHQQARIRANFNREAIILPSFFFLPLERNNRKPRERMVLWLAALSQGKQPDLFVELAAALQDIAGWRFALAGGTSDRAFLRALAERAARLPALDLVGSVPFDDTGALFARAALYINTSRPDADGLPNAFIQAWLLGTPVLSLHHDPNGWIVRHRLGFFAAGDFAAMVSECRALLCEPSRIDAMRNRCIAFARETFANPRVIDTYLEIFAGTSAAEPSLCPTH